MLIYSAVSIDSTGTGSLEKARLLPLSIRLNQDPLLQ